MEWADALQPHAWQEMELKCRCIKMRHSRSFVSHVNACSTLHNQEGFRSSNHSACIVASEVTDTSDTIHAGGRNSTQPLAYWF